MATRPEKPVALVTGASRGIGRAIAETLVVDHDVVLVGRSASTLDDVAEGLRQRGAQDVVTRVADLADAVAVQELGDSLAEAERPVQVLINNAGIADSAPLAATDDATWSRAIAVNLTAPFLLARMLVPKMVETGWGRVITIASTSALKGYRYTAAYSASKGGVVALTRALAAELAKTGVTVNALCPGFCDTDIVASAVRNISDKTGRSETEARASLERFSPMGRLVQPGEVASMVAYLCTDAAATIHGQAIAIDGGETST